MVYLSSKWILSLSEYTENDRKNILFGQPRESSSSPLGWIAVACFLIGCF